MVTIDNWRQYVGLTGPFTECVVVEEGESWTASPGGRVPRGILISENGTIQCRFVGNPAYLVQFDLKGGTIYPFMLQYVYNLPGQPLFLLF